MARKLRTKQDVKSKTPRFAGAKVDGGRRVVGTCIEFNDGTSTTLLNPSGKGAKYANELRDDCRYTNDGEEKTDKNGVPLGLTPEQRAFRGGYLKCLKDSAKAYKSKNGGN